jgi:hypothetical protein
MTGRPAWHSNPAPRALAALIAAALLALAGCGDDGQDEQAATTPTGVSVTCPKESGGETFEANVLVGKSLDAATAEAKNYACTVRPVEIDGEPQAVTMDVRGDRINVVVENDQVVEVKGVY